VPTLSRDRVPTLSRDREGAVPNSAAGRPARAALLLALLAAPGGVIAATLTGRIQLTGAPAGGNAEGVAIWLVPAQGNWPPPAPQTVRVLQKNKRFSPHVTVIGVGSTVDWPNQDPIFHNAFSNFAGQPFDTGLYPPKGTQRVVFQREGIVRVFCNIHSSMSAVIVVVPTPWFTAAARDGTFTLSGVPPGEYTLKVWYERSTEGTLRGAERRITVTADAALDPIALTEAGFVAPPPHKNKYGREYPPEPPEKAGYEQPGRSRPR
jgi:plastocyanin